MSDIVDKIKMAQDKEGMTRRALERIVQLYTDRSHFVYELLQNAEDAEAKKVRFIQYPDRLEFFHDGRPFTEMNLQGLCDIGKSDKVDNLNQIGEFGVGFKSVFSICEVVKLYSEPVHYRKSEVVDAVPFSVEIINFTTPEDIPNEPMNETFTTRFVFPYAVGKSFSGFKTIKELNRVVSSKLQNLGITTLLFMKNLEVIEYQIHLEGQEIEGKYMLEKQILNDHCSIVSALGLLEKTEQTKTEKISYLTFSRNIDSKSRRTVDIAFPITIKQNGEFVCGKTRNPYVSVYFPTETESKLKFIVQGPYRTTPNRSSIPADDEDNIKLANETAVLLRDSILELKDDKKFNMSFVKVLPLSEDTFVNYTLFTPLYETVQDMFQWDDIIPSLSGEYVSANEAMIARQEKLVKLFPDKVLNELIDSGLEYRWLPTFLTETNREYEEVYKYLTTELKVNVMRPEDLRNYFIKNPFFLPKQSDSWIVELYLMLENVGTAFSKNKKETNMLTTNIIKTSDGKFVAAYRKTEGEQYIPNVFLPSTIVHGKEVHFVDEKIYNKCRNFFDNILQLQQVNKYEFFISDIKKRYTDNYEFDEKQHIEDVKNICRYLKYDENKDEVREIIREYLVLRCKDGKMRNAHRVHIYLPRNGKGIDIEGYLKDISRNTYLLDLEYYKRHDVSGDMLCSLGVLDSIIREQNTTEGQYDLGYSRGKKPEWFTLGEFRWKLTIEFLREALLYISEHPTEDNARIKSKTILSILFENESKVCGTVHFKGGKIQNKEDEPCELIHALRGDEDNRFRSWNGKWLYNSAMELVSHKNISKYDLNKCIYGGVRNESVIYELLGFRKTASDEVEELKKTVSQSQLDIYFEEEIRRRLGASYAEVKARFESTSYAIEEQDVTRGERLPFPSVKVKNWDALKKHAAERLIYANPVKYEYSVRSIRTSNQAKESRAYLKNMYSYEGQHKYACQLCHDSCFDIEAVQIFNNPEAELDPMNLCLCPSCSALYRRIRGKREEMDLFKKKILDISETEITKYEYISIVVDEQELWFTQTHIAEIHELLMLENEVKKGEQFKKTSPKEEEKPGLAVYDSCIGKQINHKNGWCGIVTAIKNEQMVVRVTEGKRAGQEIKITLATLSEKPDLYHFTEEHFS